MQTLVGRRIGRYFLTQELGRGGMGVVYKATQVALNRTVAIKILSPHLAASHEYLARFRREAETLGRLSHENIVHIYDVDEAEGSHFIAMEFVDGASLTAILARRGPLSPACARDIAGAMASALAAAHRQGIVHRDIKPDNILVSQNGQPKLTDFGIAHMRDGRVETLAGVLLGTPYYMSPEQAAGRPVGPGSDLYSLAVVLYEMLSARVPFEAADPLALALKHVQEPPPPLRQIAPRVPEPLIREVERALAKDPAVRHASADELYQRLAAIELGHRPGAALGMELATREHPSIARCPECATPIEPTFLTCPHCGLSIRYRCGSCATLYDALSPACPVCRAPATPPEIRVAASGAPRPGASLQAVRPSPRRPSPLAPEPAEPRPVPPTSAPAGAPASLPAGRIEATREHAMPALAARAAALGAGVARFSSLAGEELRRGWSDLVSLFRQLRDPSGAPPSTRQLAVAGVVTSLLVILVLGVWRPWEGSAIDPSALLPQSDPGILTVTPGPISSGSEAQNTRRVQPPIVVPPGPAAGSEDASAPSPPPAPAPAAPAAPAASGGRDSAGALDRASADRESARHAIEDVIERQRQATESGDLKLLIADLDQSLEDRASDQLRTLHDSLTGITSRITRIRIELANDLSQATVRFHAQVAGMRRSTKQPVTIHNGEVRWSLRRTGSPPRWLIASSSGT